LGVRKLFGTVYLDLAMAGALLSPARLSSPGRLVGIPHRVVLETDPGATLELGNEGIRVNEQPASLDRERFSALASGSVLALVDDNPIALEEAHPDKGGNALDLGGRPPGQWVRSLDQAIELIGEHLPELRAELDLFIQQLVPVGYDEHTHLSASYQEAIGTIYLSLHPNPMTMAEAVIHELSHNKLYALLELDPLLHNAFSPSYSSPVRPDPRPLHGILLAVHAFLPVEALYRTMSEADHPWSRRPDFGRRFEQIREGNRRGAELLLQHGEATPVGTGLLDEIASLLD
jgi:HEXXH motif-containing protein